MPGIERVNFFRHNLNLSQIHNNNWDIFWFLICVSISFQSKIITYNLFRPHCWLLSDMAQICLIFPQVLNTVLFKSLKCSSVVLI